MTDEDIKEILKCNPQLRSINLKGCRNPCAKILKSIIQHAPEIESLFLDLDSIESDDAPEDEPDYEWVHEVGLWNGPGKICKYFGQFNNLKSLGLARSPEIVADICAEIAAADIPLKDLFLENLSVAEEKVDSFVEAISKLTNLKTLSLFYVKVMNASHITYILKQQYALRDLCLDVDFAPTAEELLEWIECAERLQRLEHYKFTLLAIDEICCIGADIFKQILRAIENRREKTKLEIFLYGGNFAANIPEYLSSAHKDALTLEIPSDHIPFTLLLQSFKLPNNNHFYYSAIFLIASLFCLQIFTLVPEYE